MIRSIIMALGPFLSGSIGGLSVRALTSVGVGLISGGAVLVAVQTLVGLVSSSMSGISGIAASIVLMSGIDYGVSILIAAMVYRATLAAMPKLGVIPS